MVSEAVGIQEGRVSSGVPTQRPLDTSWVNNIYKKAFDTRPMQPMHKRDEFYDHVLSLSLVECIRIDL